ncbi:MAG: uspA [Gammaproteobacteria bacterium]|nr:uspA [Gammaproteobacteria bacterium]
MFEYNHILAAVDYTVEARLVLQHARSLAERYGADLTLLHVVELMPVVGGIESFSYVDLYADQPELIERAENDLKKLAAEEQLSGTNLKILTGVPKVEITAYARDNDIDLIVVGSHGRHGISLILGSTANAVLHHAKCDVLAVRV